MFPIPWNKAFRKKDGTLVNMEDLAGGGSGGLPEHSSADAGKVLGVDDEGLLEWKELEGTKIYYKDFDISWDTNQTLAKFQDGAASASSFNLARPRSTVYVDISGYTPISALAIDIYTGYSFGLFIEIDGVNSSARYKVSMMFASRAIDSASCKARVFYVKNSNLVALT